MVQVPRRAQPLSNDGFCASMKTFLAPENAGCLNVIARVKVRLFPAMETEDAPVSTMHWLFCCVPAMPSDPVAPKDPASLAN